MMNRIADHLGVILAGLRSLADICDHAEAAAEEMTPELSQIEMLWQVVGELKDGLNVTEQQINSVLGMIGDVDHSLKRLGELGFEIRRRVNYVSE